MNNPAVVCQSESTGSPAGGASPRAFAARGCNSIVKMNTRSLLRHVAILALAGWGTIQSNAQTTYLYKGSADTNWANAANWNGSVAANGGITYGRITVTNHTTLGFPLSHIASMGTTIYTNAAANRALVLGSGPGLFGSMVIAGGTWESRAGTADVIANNGGSAIMTISGGNYVFTNFGAKRMVMPLSGATATLHVNSGSFSVDTIHLGDTGTSSGTGTINLNGGVLAAKVISDQNSPVVSTLNFNGGTLRALAAGTLLTVDNANVQAGGAIIDSQGFAITTAKPLVPTATPDGGLTKQGAGSLTLGAANTYKGPTAISAGTLNILTTSTGGGAYTNETGTTLGLTVATFGGTLAMSSWTIGDNTTNNLNLGSFGNPANPAIRATNLVVLGTNRVSVTGSGLSLGQFPLIKYVTSSGLTADSFVTNGFPSGISGYISNNVANNSIDLVINVAPSVVWRGETNGLPVGAWDINTTSNWFNPFTGNPTYFTGVEGVQFDETLTGTNYVDFVAAVAPGGVLVTNTATTYTFGGTNRLTGATALTKAGSGLLVLATTNDYTGITRVLGGTLRLAATNALPRGLGTGNLTVDGTLDINGYDPVLNALDGSGVIANSTAVASTNHLVLGTNGQNGDFSGQINDGANGKLDVIKLGGGNQILRSGSSTYSGGTYISAGTLQIGSDTALSTGPVVLAGGGLAPDGAAARNVANSITVSNNSSLGIASSTGTLTLAGPLDFANGARNLTINSPVIYTGSSLLSAGGLNFKLGASTFTLLGNTANWVSAMEVQAGTMMVDGATWTNGGSIRTVATTANGITRLVITNGGVVVVTNTVGVLRAGNSTGNSTGTNIFDIAGSLLFPAPGIASTDGKTLLGAYCNRGMINLLSGGLLLTRGVQRDTSGGGSHDAIFNFDGGTLKACAGDAGATYMQGLTEANVRAGGAFIDTANFNLTIGQALLQDPSSTGGGLTKLGAGILTLSGANTYTGPTIVSSGTLNTTTGSTGGGSCTNANGTVLGVSIAAAGQSLNLSGLGFGANCTNNIALGAGNPTAPVVNISGDLSLNGDLIVNVSGSGISAGTYVLMQYGARQGTGVITNGTLPALGAGLFPILLDDSANKQVKLMVIVVQDLKWAVGDGDWDLGTSNWLPLAGGSPAMYGEGDSVTFNDDATGTSPITVSLTAPHGPGNVTVSNATKDYTLMGGAIVGSAGLVKDGAAKLTLSNNNTYAGPTVISAGTLQVGNGGASGSLGSGPITDNGALVFDRVGTLAVPNVITGTGTVAQAGSGTTILSGANNYSNSTIISAGTLQLGAANVIPDGAGRGNVAMSSGTLDLAGFNETVNGLSGTGTVDNSGGASALTVGANNTTAAFYGAIQNSGSALALNKTGSGTVTLGGSNSYDGVTTLAGGILRVAHNHALGSAAAGTVITSGRLELTNGVTVTGEPLTINLDGGGNFIGAIQTVADGYATWAGPVNTGTAANTRMGAQSNATLEVAGPISGTNGFVIRNDVSGPQVGTVVFSASNSYAQDLILASGILRLAGGHDRLPAANRLWMGSNSLSSTLDLNGTSPNIAGLGVGGNQTGGPATGIYTVGNSSTTSDSTLTLGAGSGTNTTNTFTGVIRDALGAGTRQVNVTIAGGLVALNGNNTYSGLTLVTAGTLRGTGIYSGPLTVTAAGGFAPGMSIGTLTVSNDVTLGGITAIELNKSAAQTSDKVVGVSNFVAGGTLEVTNLGAALAAGDSFNVFEAATYAGQFTSIVPSSPNDNPALVWNTNDLAVLGRLVVHRPPVAVNDSGTAPLNQTTLFEAGKLMTNDSDPDGHPLSVVSVTSPSSAGGTVVLTLTNTILYTAPATGTTDSFSYTLSDNRGGLATATVNITLVSGEGFNQVGIETLGNGDAKLTYRGIPNERYALDLSHYLTNPVPWTPVITNQADGAGLLLFTNTPSGGNDFYRTRHAP